MAIEKTDEAFVIKQREIMEEINHLPHGGKKSLIYTLGCQQNESVWHQVLFPVNR